MPPKPALILSAATLALLGFGAVPAPAAPAKAPFKAPLPTVLLYPATPGDVAALVDLRTRLRLDSRVQVLTYDPESAAIQRASAETTHPEWLLQVPATDAARMTLARALGASFYAVVSPGRLDDTTHVELVETAPAARTFDWTGTNREFGVHALESQVADSLAHPVNYDHVADNPPAPIVPTGPISAAPLADLETRGTPPLTPIPDAAAPTAPVPVAVAPVPVAVAPVPVAVAPVPVAVAPVPVAVAPVPVAVAPVPVAVAPVPAILPPQPLPLIKSTPVPLNPPAQVAQKTPTPYLPPDARPIRIVLPKTPQAAPVPIAPVPIAPLPIAPVPIAPLPIAPVPIAPVKVAQVPLPVPLVVPAPAKAVPPKIAVPPAPLPQVVNVPIQKIAAVPKPLFVPPIAAPPMPKISSPAIAAVSKPPVQVAALPLRVVPTPPAALPEPISPPTPAPTPPVIVVKKRQPNAEDMTAIQPLLAKGDAALDGGDTVSAIALYRQAVNGAPLSVVPRLKLAQAYQKDGLSDRALDEARRALEIAPDSVPVQQLLSDLDQQNGTSAGTLIRDRATLAQTPNNSAAHVTLADDLWNSGDLGGAEAEYKTAVALAPGAGGPAEAQLAQLYAAEARYTDCLAILKDSGSGGYALAIGIVKNRSDTLSSTLSASRAAFAAGKSTREQFYDDAKKLSAEAQALAEFVAQVAPPKAYTLPHLHRMLSTNLLAQESAALVTFIETGDARQSDSMAQLEHAAATEMLTAQAAEERLGLWKHSHEKQSEK